MDSLLSGRFVWNKEEDVFVNFYYTALLVMDFLSKIRKANINNYRHDEIGHL